MKNLPANAGDTGSVSGFGRSPGEANGNPLHYSCLGNPTDRGVWQATVHVVRKESDTTERLKKRATMSVKGTKHSESVPCWNSSTWPPDAKNWLIGKDPGDGKGWRQEEKGTTKDEMVGWHYWLNGHESEQAPGVGDRQGDLACCSPWGHKQSDKTEQLNCVHITHFTL